MRRLYKQAKGENDYSYMFVEWLKTQTNMLNSSANNYILKVYMNALKDMSFSSDIGYDIKEFDKNLNLKKDFDEWSYQGIKNYLNKEYKSLANEIYSFIMNNKNVICDIGYVLQTEGIYYNDILWEWAEKEGLNEFCEENKILEDNVNINDAKLYFEGIAEELNWFEDARDFILKKNIDGNVLKEYINKNLDEFAKYIFEDIIKIKDKKYNEEKADYDEFISKEKAKNYMNNIMDNGIDYSKLGTNRILKRMYKDAKKMK